MCDTTQRLIALLRILEQGPAPFGMLGDDAMLDACFGHRSSHTGSSAGPTSTSLAIASRDTQQFPPN